MTELNDKKLQCLGTKPSSKVVLTPLI